MAICWSLVLGTNPRNTICQVAVLEVVPTPWVLKRRLISSSRATGFHSRQMFAHNDRHLARVLLHGFVQELRFAHGMLEVRPLVLDQGIRGTRAPEPHDSRDFRWC